MPSSIKHQQAAALATSKFHKCLEVLGGALATSLKTPPSDPKHIPKKGGDIMRLRILPRKPRPADFWNATWCFYEIGVGRYADAGLCVGGVQFLQYSAQQTQGGGRWTRRVADILRDLQSLRPEDFQFTATTENGKPSPRLFTRYHPRDHKSFPVDVAAEHLAWLISESLPRFEALEE